MLWAAGRRGGAAGRPRTLVVGPVASRRGWAAQPAGPPQQPPFAPVASGAAAAAAGGGGGSAPLKALPELLPVVGASRKPETLRVVAIDRLGDAQASVSSRVEMARFGRESALLTGSAEIKDGIETASVLAVLDATNRWVEF